MKAFDISSYGSTIYVAGSDNNTITVCDSDDDTSLVRVNGLRLVVVRLVNVQSDFLYKGRCHYEENQHDKDYV